MKRHFRELGVDVDADPFTAVGHRRHVRRRLRQRDAATRTRSSCSPLSTTATSSSTRTPTWSSFAERKRLFQLPGSSWNDYDRSLLSAGGDVSTAGEIVTPSTRGPRRARDPAGCARGDDPERS